MKWTAALILVNCLQVSATGYSQGKITLSVKNAPLEKIFSLIEEQTGYTFWYDNSVLIHTTSVDMNVRDASLEEALDICCKNQPLSFSLVGKMVVIKEKPNKSDKSPPPSINIQGQVTNEKGEPVPGISVIVKGSSKGVTTDYEGKFEIPNVGEQAVLVFTGANIERQEELVHGREEMVVHVKTRVNKLDEIQIIGYGTTTQRVNTGTVTTVTSEEISRQPVYNVLSAMEGLVPGMFIQSNSGFAGSNFNVQIRGINSIAAGSNPLYVIDGIPFNSNSLDLISGSSPTAVTGAGSLSPLSLINPSDIESVEVLQGADATSIYGSRAANGVVLITTKKVKAGKTTFGASVYSGIGQVEHYIPMLDIHQYLGLRRMAYANDGMTPGVADAPDLLVWDTTQNTDWQNKILGGKAHITDVQASMSGGDAHTRILFGAGFHKETTVFNTDAGVQRVSSHLQAEHSSIDNRFNFNISVNYALDNNKLVSDPTPVVNLPPDYPDPKSTGEITWRPNVYSEPYAQLNTPFQNKSNLLIGSATVSYAFKNGLNAKVAMGYTQTDMNQMQLFPSSVIPPVFASLPYSYFGENHLTTWIIEPQLTYNWKIGSGKLDLLAGSTLQQTLTKGQLVYASNYANDGQLSNEAAAGDLTIFNNTEIDYRYASFFLRTNYNFKGKYILNVNFRRDGSSRFGSGNQFGNFGSLGAAWIFTEEGFVKNSIPVLSFGKLRASYGVTGNDQIPDYGYLSSYTTTGFPYQVPGLRPARIANSDFGWESTWKLEAALELGFWKDRLMVTGIFYQNRTSHQLVNYPIPSQSGFSSFQGNLPAVVQNTGFEMSLQVTALKTNDWKWKLFGNLTIPKNKLISFPNIENTVYGTTNLIVGKPLNLVWGYHYLGTDPQTGAPLVADIDHDAVPGSYPGDYIPFATTMPSYYGGFGQTLSWKNWSLDILFQYVSKRGIQFSEGIPGSINNQPISVYNDLWKKPGDIANIPKASTTSYDYYTYRYADAGYDQSGSYVKLKNIYLSYSFNSFIPHVPLIRIFLQGQNIFTITHFQGYDPEAAGPNMLPNLRILTAGIHADF